MPCDTVVTKRTGQYTLGKAANKEADEYTVWPQEASSQQPARTGGPQPNGTHEILPTMCLSSADHSAVRSLDETLAEAGTAPAILGRPQSEGPRELRPDA